MIGDPNAMKEWWAQGRMAIWAFLRVKLAWLVLGSAITLIAQSLTGFWSFREAQQDMLREQFSMVVEAQGQFESELGRIDRILQGQAVPGAGIEYANAAQEYIRSMETISRSIPETSTEVNNYIDSIAALRRYYDVPNPPAPNTDDWMIFYGDYRQDLDRYVAAREQYLSALSDRLGSYVRHLINS